MKPSVIKNKSSITFEKLRLFAAIGRILAQSQVPLTWSKVSNDLPAELRGSDGKYTKCVRGVEAYYGLSEGSLIESKPGRGAVITDKGREILNLFNEVVRSYERVERRDWGTEGQLRIAAPNFIALHALTGLLGDWAAQVAKKQYRQYSVSETSDTLQGISLLRDGAVDVVFGCVLRRFEIDNVVVVPLPGPDEPQCSFDRILLIPKSCPALMNALPKTDSVTFDELNTVPQVTVLAGDESERIVQTDSRRIVVSTYEMARRLAEENRLALLTIGWSRVVGTDWKQHFHLKRLAPTAANANVAQSDSLAYLHDPIKVVAMHREYPAPSTSLLEFIKSASDMFRSVRDREVI